MLNETEIDVKSIIESALRLVKTRAEKGGVNLQVLPISFQPIIRGDERRLKQIFVNLLSNAVKFSNVGGTVSVDVETNEEGLIEISVADNGIGMTVEDIEKAMETFGQVGREVGVEGEGTGLGLPLTKGLVEAHGGTMNIESNVDQGTTVTVLIPKERVVH